MGQRQILPWAFLSAARKLPGSFWEHKRSLWEVVGTCKGLLGALVTFWELSGNLLGAL